MSKRAFRYFAIATMLVTALFFPRLVLASLILEIEPNNSAAAAQNIPNSSFTSDFVAIITNSTIFPHVSIDGKGGAGSTNFDFYRFTTAGSGIILDIDNNGTVTPGNPVVDTEIAIWNSAGLLIGENDNMTAPVDPGSTSLANSFLRLDGLPAGTYTVAVCQSPDCAFSSGFGISGTPLPSGVSYLLHISLIPEPSALILLGAGLVGIGIRRHLKKR